jgi:hypothetical protein
VTEKVEIMITREQYLSGFPPAFWFEVAHFNNLVPGLGDAWVDLLWNAFQKENGYEVSKETVQAYSQEVPENVLQDCLENAQKKYSR